MPWKIYDKLFFMGPASLGDSIVMNGIVHYYADRCHKLHLPINNDFKETLIALYSGFPNITLIGFPPDARTYDLEEQYCKIHGLSKILRPPVFGALDNGDVFVPPLWDQQIYSFFELPFELRYSNFRLPTFALSKAKAFYDRINPSNEEFILVHRGTKPTPSGHLFSINTNKRIIDITNNLSSNMLDYTVLILKASEIHCTASGFLHFVDSLYLHTKAKLYYHDVRKNAAMMSISNTWNNFSWDIIKYPKKFE